MNWTDSAGIDMTRHGWTGRHCVDDAFVLTILFASFETLVLMYRLQGVQDINADSNPNGSGNLWTCTVNCVHEHMQCTGSASAFKVKPHHL